MLKCVIFSLLVAFVASLPEDLTEEDIHEIVKDSAEHIQKSIYLDDIWDKRFEYRWLLFKKTGSIDLTNGELSYLNSYELRRNPRKISSTRFEISLRFKKLRFAYDYETDVSFSLLLDNRGVVYGDLNNLDLTITVVVKDDEFVMEGRPIVAINDFDIIFEKGSLVKTIIYNVFSHTFEDVVKALINDEYATYCANRIIEEMNISAKYL